MMIITEAVNRFYYRMALNELRAMSRGDYFRGLSYNSVLYLNVIDLEPDCTAGKLAEKLRVSKAASTLKIAELERRGFVIKQPSEQDRRVVYIRLTQPTREALAYYDRVFDRIGERLERDYREEDLKLFAEILGRISEYDWI